MRLYAPLLFALFVLRARAATIPERLAPEIEKKIPVDEEFKPEENNSSEQELIDQTNAVKDVENNLRNKPVEGIPVTVIIDDDDVKLKAGTEVNEVIEEEIVRPQADLRNPGPPQRQEHETQNPEFYEDSRRIVTNLEKSIKDSEIILKQGFQGVTNDIQHWFENNEQIGDIQKSIQNLQSSFTVELKKLNETVKTILGKQSKVANESPISEDQANNLKTIKSQLGYLEDNFNTGLKTLAEGVQVVGMLRADTEGAASSESQPVVANPAPANPETAQPANPSPAPPAATTPPASTNPIISYLTQMQTFMLNGFNNISQTLNNFMNNQSGGNQASSSATPAAVASPTAAPSAASPQADEPASGQQPTIWQGVQTSFNNFISSIPFPPQNPFTQSAETQTGQSTTARPIAQFIQNNPIVQGMANFFQGNRGQSTQAPTAATIVAVSQPAAPAAQPEKAPEQPQPTPGPIRQIIQSSPIVQGITHTVQRIQGSITSYDTPRDTPETADGEKGIIVVPIKGGHGHGGGSGDNNSVDVKGTEAEENTIKEDKPEVPLPEEPKKDDVTEPEKVADKTE